VPAAPPREIPAVLRRIGFEGLAGRSRAIARVLDQVRHVAPTRSPVLIVGEPGTGRGLLAWTIHSSSPRRSRPFMRQACEGPDAAALEVDVFGRGPRTGGRPGFLESGDGGTLFLDEIAALEAPVQLRLFRLLHDREFERVGGDETLTADVRLVAATARDLGAEVRAGRFRADLYERLSVVRIALPPLREHREDMPHLVRTLLRELNQIRGRRLTGVTPGALERLARHDWPGHLRELLDTLEGMVGAATGRRALGLSDLPPALREAGGRAERIELTVGMTVEDAERRLIDATMRATGGDKPRAAAMLGLGLRTLYRKLRSLPPAPAAGPRKARRAPRGAQPRRRSGR